MYTPKFKRGDWIKSKKHGRIARIVSLLVECYNIETIDGEGWWLDYASQDNWEITSNPYEESGSSEIPNDIEEAAEEKYPVYWKDYPKDRIARSELSYDANKQRRDAFIVGAKWDREQMMKEAMEVEVVGDKRDLRLIDSTQRCLFDAKRGDWLKIIIVKEEE